MWEKFRKETLEVDRVWRYLCFAEYFPGNKMICPWMSASFPGACWKDSVTMGIWRLSTWAVVQTSLFHCWVHKPVRAEANVEPFPVVLVRWPLFPAPVHRLQPHYWLTFPSSWKREEGMDLRNTCKSRTERKWWLCEHSRRMEKKNWDDSSLSFVTDEWGHF